MVLFDLSVFNTTSLPFVIHDSFLYKNIENDAVARIMNLYISLRKQSFIAIDEVHKYGNISVDLLITKSVIQLSDDSVLYIKDWRQ